MAGKPATPRVLVVPVFIPNRGCPHRCIFCNQSAVSGEAAGPRDVSSISATIESFLRHKASWHRHVQISFYGGNFLGLPAEEIRELLRLGARFVKSERVDSLRFSTRPDTVRRGTLELIRPYPVETVEIGVQSMDDGVLKASGRGHTADDTRAAVTHLRKAGYQIGLQMMVGLPGDTPEKALATGKAIADLHPDFVRIYPTLVLGSSPLARRYRSGRYQPMPLQAAVTLVRQLYGRFMEKDIPVVRMGLQLSGDFDTRADVLAGPYHPAFGHLVLSEYFLERALCRIPPGSVYGEELVLRVHPDSIPKMRGDKNRNIEILEKMLHTTRVTIEPDEDLGINQVRVGERIR